MSTGQRGLGGFEMRLLHELRSTVVANQASGEGRRSSRRRFALRPHRRLALAGLAAVLAAVAAGAIVQFVSGGAQPAYAVSKNDDGTVTVEISSLSDAAGLESKLREAGIPAVVQYLPPGKTCKQPWPTAAPGSPSNPGGGAEGEVEATAVKGGVEHTPDHTRFTISKKLPADTTLVIMTQVGGPSETNGPSSIGITLAHGEVQPCQVVDAPAGSTPFGPPPPGAQLHTNDGRAGTAVHADTTP